MTCSNGCADCRCAEPVPELPPARIWIEKGVGVCRKPVREGGLLLCEEHTEAFVKRMRSEW